MASQAYTLGQLMAVLQKHGHLDEVQSNKMVTANILGTLSPGLKRMTESGQAARDILAPFMQEFDEIPSQLSVEQWGGFWLGYYHERAGKRSSRPGEGRPRKAEGEKRVTRHVRVGEEWYDYIEEMARRRGESMGQFVEHVLRMYRDETEDL